MPPLIDPEQADPADMELVSKLTELEIRRKEKLQFIDLMGDER